VRESSELPPGLTSLGKVEGGGNSLFESLLFCLEEVEGLSVDIPDPAFDLRLMLIDFLAQNPTKFNLLPAGDSRKRMKAMRHNEQLPCEEVVLVACFVFEVEIHVHHGAQWPVVYRADRSKTSLPILHLQCKSGIHFNPLFDEKQRRSREVGNEDCVNYCCESENGDENGCKVKESRDHNVQCINSKPTESLSVPSSCFVVTCGVKFCALIDTGAQVSLIGEDTVKLLIQNEPNLKIHDLDANLSPGISGGKTKVLGYVELKLQISYCIFDIPVPFAIVKTCEVPCCAILGANYLIANRISVEFGNFGISGQTGRIDLSSQVKDSVNVCVNGEHHWTICSFTGIVTADLINSDSTV
jgi:hypothetical protein